MKACGCGASIGAVSQYLSSDRGVGLAPALPATGMVGMTMMRVAGMRVGTAAVMPVTVTEVAV